MTSTRKDGTMMPLSTTTRRGLAAVLALGLTAAGAAATHLASAAGAPGAAAPRAAAVHAAALTPSGCDRTGSPVVCTLYARSGSVALPGLSTPTTFWSYTGDTSTPVAPVGPTLVVDQGDVVRIELHNQLAEATSLSLPQVDGFADDSTGAAPGGTATYDFTAVRPGTYLYQAGSTDGGSRQVAMGLVGALVVRSSTAGTAYGTPASAYDDEGVVLMTDVDPALNAAPATFDMRSFTSRIRLINGQAFPATQHILTGPSRRVLLRQLNGGIVQHSLGVLGVDQDVVGTGARALSYGYTMSSETVPAGDTLDTIAAMPSAGGPLYAVYDTSTRLDNNGSSSGGIIAFGGALTFLETGAGTTPPATATITGLTAAPARSNGAAGITFDATATSSDASAITAVEYTLDNAGFAPGSGTQLAGGPSPLTITAQPVATAALATGSHTLLVRAQTGGTTWGPLASAQFVIDKTGPVTTSLTLSPTATNGTAVGINAAVSDVTTGGSAVASAAFTLDGAPAGTLAVSPVGGATVSATGSVPPAALTGLTDGVHTVAVAGTDVLGNAGAPGPAGTPVGRTFVLDRVGPATSGVVVTPSPNNGTQGVSYDPTSVEVRASVGDPTAADGSASGVASGEAFIDTAGAPGTGFPLARYTGTGPLQLLGTFPVSELTKYADGTHAVLVRGKDAAGNWGALASGSLVIDRAGRIFASDFTATTLVPPWAQVVTSGTGSSATRVLVSGNPALATAVNSTASSTPTAYVVDTTPTAEPSYKIAFSFTPNTLVTNGRQVVVLQARTSTGQAYRVEYRTSGTGNATRQLRLVVTRANGTTTSTPITLAGSGAVTVKVSWASSTSSTATLTAGSTIVSMSGLNTGALKVETAWLGLSGASGSGIYTGTAYFDTFVSNRLLLP